MARAGKFPGELQEGDLIGGTCTILDYIGRGAMGHVYRVRHNTLNAEYALKMLSREQANKEANRLFQREAGTIKELSHPNVVRIYDIGLHDGELPFYAMELLVGRDLGVILREKGPLSPLQAAATFAEVAAGLGYVHERGVIHRDVKPSNVFMLDKPGAGGGKVKVVDFGIVSFRQTKSSTGNEEEEIHGTPSYMSPEQCMGLKVDARSDIYSLGCSLFEALTGNLPFQGKHPVETMTMQVDEPAPTLSEKAGGHEFPEELETIIAKTLQKRPEDRYQTMDELARELNSLVSAAKWSAAMTQPGAAPPTEGAADASSKIPNKKALIIGVSAVAGIALLGGVAMLCMPHGKTDTKGGQTTATGAGHSSGSSSKGTGSSGSSSKGTESSASTESKGTETGSSSESKGGESGQSAAPAVSETLPVGQPSTISLTSKKPFCTTAVVGGKMFRMFDMPTDVVVGLFKTKASAPAVRAIGLLKYPMTTKLTFTPSDVVTKAPDCLSRFQQGDIYHLKLYPEACNDQIFKAAAKMSTVKRLSIADCKNLTDASYEQLKAFTNLTWFDASNSSFGGSKLAQNGNWGKLEVMNLSGTTDVEPVLEQLLNSKNLLRLGVSNCNLTEKEIKAVAAVYQMTELDISHNKLTKQDLITLGSLVHLVDLNLAETGLSGSDLDPLRKFKYLTHLDLSGVHLTNKDLANVISFFELNELDLKDTGLDGSIVDVLRGYTSLKKLHIGSAKLKQSEMDRIKDGLPLLKVD